MDGPSDYSTVQRRSHVSSNPVRFMPEADSEIWEFLRDLEAEGDVWTWHRKVGGVVERRSEGPIVGLSKALVSAMRNGFIARKHVWVVSGKEFDTRYAPGTAARAGRRAPQTVPPRNAPPTLPPRGYRNAQDASAGR